MDFATLKSVLAAFEREGVRYAIFGAAALNLHGLARFTEDLDVFLEPNADNVTRVRRALASALHKIAVGDPTRMGLPAPDHAIGEAHPTISSDLFTRLARRGRVVIAIDDLQWADADGLAALRELALLWVADRVEENLQQYLEDHGIETTVLRMPANFPPSGTASRELSGMGTPDLVGSYGEFSFYTSKLFAFAGEDIAGGDVYEVDVYDGVVEAKLYGPDNPFLVDAEKLTSEFTVHLDPVDPVVLIVAGSEQVVLREGEFSDWVPVEFPMIPTQTLYGMVRFYLRSVRPDFELYASPVNIDPMAPAMPVSSDEDYASRLAKATGRFYTQGMPEDTKALQEGVLTTEEFLAQARIAIQQASLEAALEDLRVQQQRYSLGASTQLELLTTQTQLNSARYNLVNARYQVRIARAQLEQLLGREIR